MMIWTRMIAIVALAYGVVFSLAGHAQEVPGDGPRYAEGTRLIRPTNYREWIFLGSSLGLTYLPPANAPAAPPFGNVFVNPSSYRSFMQTGRWPNATMLVAEVRRSSSEGEFVKGERFQADLSGLRPK